MKQIVSIEKFIRDFKFDGEWSISYTDSTHLENGEFLDLGKISFPVSVAQASTEILFLPFRFNPVSLDDLKAQILLRDTAHREKHVDKGVRKIVEAIEESLARCGMSNLRFWIKRVNSDNIAQSLSEIYSDKFLVLTTDTGAIKRGIVTFLLETLPKTIFWIIVPSQVLYEVQQKAEELKNLPKNGKFNSSSVCVNDRPIETIIPREIENIKSRVPVEVLNVPSNVLKVSENWKNDRFIIETAKGLRQQRSLLKEVFLATGDKTVFSIASLENLNSIYIRQSPLMNEIWSFRFNMHKNSGNKSFFLCPVHNFIWDLTCSFSTIKLQSKDGKVLKLNYYFSDKLGITHDVLELEEM